MISLFKSIISNIVFVSLYWLARLFPKDKNLWVFGSWLGQNYSDNSKYLFEYVNKHHQEVKAVWLTNKQAIVNDLRSRNYRAFKVSSLMGFWFSSRAGVAICDHYIGSDLTMLLRGGQTKLIQLWHGIPLKKLGHDDEVTSAYITRVGVSARVSRLTAKLKDLKRNTGALFKSLRPFLGDKFDLQIASSDEDEKTFKTAFDAKTVAITGYPRNDILYNKKKSVEEIRQVTYLPTFRGQAGFGTAFDPFIKYNFDFTQLSEALKKMGCQLSIKMHPGNWMKVKSSVADRCLESSEINFIDNNFDANQLLRETDVLITDYSSVYFDFLLTGRPIIFAPFDCDEYLASDHEFYYDYDEVTPGPKCFNWNEVLLWVGKFLKDPSLYCSERDKMRIRFHKYCDGENSKRVFDEIKKLV